jgi:hypothetical protein
MFDKKKKVVNQVLEQPTDNKIRKTNSSQKIVYDKPSKSWKVAKKTRHYVYSESFRKWNLEHEDIALLPLSTLNPEPKKCVILPIIVTKPIVNPEDGTLGLGYFLREYEYKVTEEYPSEFLILKHGAVFRNNFALKECQPLPIIEGAKVQGIIFSQVGKDKRISESEAQTMVQTQETKIYTLDKDGLRFQLYD